MTPLLLLLASCKLVLAGIASVLAGITSARVTVLCVGDAMELLLVSVITVKLALGWVIGTLLMAVKGAFGVSIEVVVTMPSPASRRQRVIDARSSDEEIA